MVGSVALDHDVFVLCRREPEVLDRFVARYADLRAPAGTILLEPPLPRDALGLGAEPFPADDDLFPGWLELPARSQRAALDLGLRHRDWAFTIYLPAAAGAPTDQCCVAFTRDAHMILGLDLVDPGSAGDDAVAIDPVPVLEALVDELGARAGLIGWEVTPFGTAEEFEAMLRGELRPGVGKVRLDLPRWLDGRWMRGNP
jgi:hypothetical protein